MRKESLYLDTSVVNVYRDPRDPFLQKQTHAFWRKLPRFRVFVSEVVIAEIDRAPTLLRVELQEIIEGFSVLPLTGEAEELAQHYVKEGVFSPRDLADATHVAVATTSGIDYLVSWNFRHLVKVQTRRLVNFINQREGYKTVDIVAPSEL